MQLVVSEGMNVDLCYRVRYQGTKTGDVLRVAKNRFSDVLALDLKNKSEESRITPRLQTSKNGAIEQPSTLMRITRTLCE